MKTSKQSHKFGLKTNIIFNTIYQVLILIAPFITSPYISRVLLPTGQGSYSYANSFVSYFIVAASYGFLNYGTVLISKNRDNKQKYSKTFWELFTAKLLISTLVTIIYGTCVGLNLFYSDSYPLNSTTVYVVFGLTILSTAFDLTFLFQGLENFVSLCVRNLFIKILNIILIFVLVKSSNDYINYVIIMSVSTLLSALSTLLVIPQKISIEKFSIKNVFAHCKGALVYFIPSAAVSIYTVASKTIVGLMIENPDISGFYDAADKLITIIVTVINSLNTILLSRMVYLYEQKDEKRITALTRKISELYMVSSFACFAGILLINPYFTPAFFGEAFSPTIPLVIALSPKILVVPVSNILNAIYFIPKGKIKKTNIFYIVTVVFNLTITLIFTKFWSVLGAAIASTLTELFLSALYFVFSNKDIHFLKNGQAFWKAFDASLIMFGVCFIFEKILSNFFSPLSMSIVLILLGGMAYVIIMLIFREKLITSNLALVKNKIITVVKKSANWLLAYFDLK